MNTPLRSLLVLLALVAPLQAQEAVSPLNPRGPLEARPADPYFAKFNPLKAPSPSGLLLKAGDRLAICGDSITEQKLYSRIMETYLTVCVPELKVTVRQYGWSGETAEGFRRRMTNDCLRFQPTVATTCYGMNDHRYRAYDDANGRWYVEHSRAILQAFKSVGARVVQGSPGCVGKVPGWTKSGDSTLDELNLNLCALRNLGLELAVAEGAAFADVYWPMLRANFDASRRFGADYAVPGKDGVHPDWAGQTLMAWAFLKALGLDGDLGTITVDLQASTTTATGGHVAQSFSDGTLTLTSPRYPFCATGPADKDNSIRSGMTLVPFNEDLNRLKLVVKGGAAGSYRITWGATAKTYSTDQLAKGVNLAADFEVNPFSEAFAKVDEAVAAKQNYETRQIKTLFHGDEGRVDMEATVALTEKARKRLADAIVAAFKPVQHTLRIEAQ